MSLSGGCAESVMMQGMVIDMEEARLQTIAQVRAFLDGATEIAFRVAKTERYPFIERVLTRFGYASQGRIGKGVLLRYLARITGLSRQTGRPLARPSYVPPHIPSYVSLSISICLPRSVQFSRPAE